jgi:hypothetical protein
LHACRSTLEDPQAEATIAQGNAEFAARMSQAAEQGRIAHQNSPEYKRARSLGYSDVGDISFLKLHEDMDGEARLKTMLITVDEICGQYFRATQYVKPYVIYTVRPSDGGCGEEKRVAIVGGRSVEKGTELEFVIMVIAVSCVKLLSAHNSTQHTSRKHKV